jgi:hypothetical protein
MYSLFTTDSVTKPFPFLNVPSITNPCYCFVNNSAPCFDRMKHGMSATEKSNQSFLSHPGDSFPVLYVVCQSDIPATTLSTCHR